MFESILGNEPIKTYLMRALTAARLPHALLFSGPSGIGKQLFAKEIAQHLLQSDPGRIASATHPDFHPLHPEGKSGLHSIESLRSLIEQAHEAPFEAPAKVFLLFDAERMQPAAANALLKTLEEPQPDTTLILLSAAPKELLPTILSRCIQLSFLPLSEEEITSSLRKRGVPERFAKLAQGSLGRALQLASGPDIEGALIQLLAEPPFYPDLMQSLEALEAKIDTEDPVEKNQNAERLFAAVLMWYRDQEAKALSLPSRFYFFPEAPSSSRPLPLFSLVEKAVDEARLGFQRNMKLSWVLERLFARI